MRHSSPGVLYGPAGPHPASTCQLSTQMIRDGLRRTLTFRLADTTRFPGIPTRLDGLTTAVTTGVTAETPVPQSRHRLAQPLGTTFTSKAQHGS